MDMADAVTYADLKFAETSPQEMKLDDALEEEENTAEDGDVMYENFTCPKPLTVRTEPAAPPTGAVERLRSGFGARAPILLLLLLLLSLIFLASTIGLAVKCVHLSRQFHHLSVNHMEQNGSFSERLQRMEKDLEAAENSLERSRKEKEEMDWEIRNLNTSLLENEQKVKISTEEKEATEGRLKEAESQIEEWKKGLCAKDWILFGRKCLFKSEEQKTWEESKKYCETTDSNLIVVERDDAEIQNFLFKNEIIWVGKVLIMSKESWSKKQTWRWPSSYDAKDWYKCWRIDGGLLGPVYCWEKHYFICEKNIVMMSLKESNYYSSFTMWNTDYKCKVTD